MDPQVLTNMPVQAVQHPFVVDEDGVLKIRVGKGRRESTHPRMVCTELYMHLTARTSPTGQPETDAAFYSAQMIHYGIPGDSHLARAKKSLLDTFRVKPDGTGVLHVPETIKTIERNLKKQYKTLLTKSKLVEAERRKAAELAEKLKALKAEQSGIWRRALEIDEEVRVLEENAKQVRQNFANLTAVEQDQTVPEKVEDVEEPETNADEVDTGSINQSSDESESDMHNGSDVDVASSRRAKHWHRPNRHSDHEPDPDQDTVDTDAGNGSSDDSSDDSFDQSEDELESGTMEESVSKSRPAKSQAELELSEDAMYSASIDKPDNTSSSETDDLDSDVTEMSSVHESDKHLKRKAKCAVIAPSQARKSKRARISESGIQSEAIVQRGEAGPGPTTMSHSGHASPNAASNSGDSASPALCRSLRSNTTHRLDSNPPSAHSALEHQRRELLKKTSGTWTISTLDGKIWVTKPDFKFSIGKCFQTGSTDHCQDSSAKIKRHYMWCNFGDADTYGCAIGNGELDDGRLKLVFTWRTLPAYDPIHVDRRRMEVFFDKQGGCEGYIYGCTAFTEDYPFYGRYLRPLASDTLVTDFSNAYFAIPRLVPSKCVVKRLSADPTKQPSDRHDTTPEEALQYLVKQFRGHFTIINSSETMWAGERRPSISIVWYCGQDADAKRQKLPQEITFVGRIKSDNFCAYIVADSTPNVSHLSEGGLKITFTWRRPKENTTDDRGTEGKLVVNYVRQGMDGFLTGASMVDRVPMKTAKRQMSRGKAFTWWKAFHECDNASTNKHVQRKS